MCELISVIIPVYNVELYLDRCINSITKQTYNNIEIILIDDGSEDKSSEICDKWKEKDGRIKVIHIQNKGVSNARNLGLNVSKGKYILFVDSDDYVEKNMISKLYESLKENNSELSICSYYYKIKNKKERADSSTKLSIMTKKQCLDNIAKDYYKGYLWNKLFCRKIIEKINLRFDINKIICEDLIFVVKYIEECNKISYIPEPLYYYVIHENSTMNNMNQNKRYKQIMAIVEIIKLLKQQNISNVYFEYEKMFIFMAMDLYEFVETEKKQIIKHTVKEYVKDGCIKNEKNILKKIKLILVIFFPYIVEIMKKIKRRR